MEYAKAASILTNLANGIDPVSGNALPPVHVIHSPDAIRALFTASEILNGLATKQKRKAALADNTGKAWTPEEDRNLIREFEAAVDFIDIAKAHGRTRGSITARLERLGKLAPRSFAHADQRLTTND